MSSRKKVGIIQHRMKQLGLTHRQLAQHVMLSVNDIISWLDEQIEIPYHSAFKIYDLLSLDPEDIGRKV